jgi:hypothetical protein
MARASTAPTFLAAVEEAHASAVTALCSSLTCACVSPREAAVCAGDSDVPHGGGGARGARATRDGGGGHQGFSSGPVALFVFPGREEGAGDFAKKTETPDS